MSNQIHCEKQAKHTTETAPSTNTVANTCKGSTQENKTACSPGRQHNDIPFQKADFIYIRIYIVINSICQLYIVYVHYMLDASDNCVEDKLQFHRIFFLLFILFIFFFALYFLLLKIHPYNPILKSKRTNQPTNQSKLNNNKNKLFHSGS